MAARLLTAQANAHALASDLASFRAAIGHAQDALENASGDGPVWARYFTAAHLAGTAMRSLLDLDRPVEALAFQQQALELGPGNARTRALHTALTATAHTRAGNLEQAAHLAVQALQLSRRIRSRRVIARITLLSRVLAPYRQLPEVADFLEQAAAQTRQAPARAIRAGVAWNG